MRTTIHVDHGRVLLLRIEIHGKHEAIVERCLAVGSLDGACHDFRHIIVLPGRAVAHEVEDIRLAALLLRTDEVDMAEDVVAGPGVADPTA